MKTSLEVKILGEELLQQKWPKHIPIIMFLLVTTVTYLKNKVTVTGFLVTGVIGLGLGRDSGAPSFGCLETLRDWCGRALPVTVGIITVPFFGGSGGIQKNIHQWL